MNFYFLLIKIRNFWNEVKKFNSILKEKKVLKKFIVILVFCFILLFCLIMIINYGFDIFYVFERKIEL